MFVYPLMGHKDVFGNRPGEVDVRFRKVQQHPISENLGKMVEMLGSSLKPDDQE